MCTGKERCCGSSPENCTCKSQEFNYVDDSKYKWWQIVKDQAELAKVFQLDMEENAGALYSSYCRAVGGKAFNGDPLPDWETFKADPNKQLQVKAWIEVAIEADLMYKSHYCPTCDSCGEDGCCSGSKCKGNVCLYGKHYAREYEYNKELANVLYDKLLSLDEKIAKNAQSIVFDKYFSRSNLNNSIS